MATKVDNLRLYALSPNDVAVAQSELRGWLAAKKEEVEGDIVELTECVSVAAEARMQAGAWRKRLAVARRRLQFLDKCGAAVEQGYLVIPNLPLNVFAIRVAEGAEASGYAEHKNWKPNAEEFETDAEELPAGEGQYVSPIPKLLRDRRKDIEKNAAGLPHEVTVFTAQALEHRDVVFPVAAVKPEILSATKRALAERIFDEIGLVQDGGRKGDPIVVGRLKHWKYPKERSKGLMCFIGWWFDTRALD